MKYLSTNFLLKCTASVYDLQFFLQYHHHMTLNAGIQTFGSPEIFHYLDFFHLHEIFIIDFFKCLDYNFYGSNINNSFFVLAREVRYSNS